MEKIDENVKLEKEIHAILNYFKLIYIEKLTKDKSINVFKMLNGNKMIKNLLEDSNNKFISLEDNNFNLSNNLFIKVSKALSVNYSVSPLLIEELKNLGWIDEVDGINPEDKLIDTILLNSSNSVLDNILNNYDIFKSSKYYREVILHNRLNNTKKLVKKLED